MGIAVGCGVGMAIGVDAGVAVSEGAGSGVFVWVEMDTDVWDGGCVRAGAGEVAVEPEGTCAAGEAQLARIKTSASRNDLLDEFIWVSIEFSLVRMNCRNLENVDKIQ